MSTPPVRQTSQASPASIHQDPSFLWFKAQHPGLNLGPISLNTQKDATHGTIGDRRNTQGHLTPIDNPSVMRPNNFTSPSLYQDQNFPSSYNNINQLDDLSPASTQSSLLSTPRDLSPQAGYLPMLDDSLVYDTGKSHKHLVQELQTHVATGNQRLMSAPERMVNPNWSSRSRIASNPDRRVGTIFESQTTPPGENMNAQLTPRSHPAVGVQKEHIYASAPNAPASYNQNQNAAAFINSRLRSASDLHRTHLYQTPLPRENSTHYIQKPQDVSNSLLFRQDPPPMAYARWRQTNANSRSASLHSSSSSNTSFDNILESDLAGLSLGSSSSNLSDASKSDGKSEGIIAVLGDAINNGYTAFVERILRAADQQASIYLQQKLKASTTEGDNTTRIRIISAICAYAYEMSTNRFGNWAMQRCLEAAKDVHERRFIVGSIRNHVIDIATNSYGCHVIQKCLEVEEEDTRLSVLNELLSGDISVTILNKHASHVWSKVMELTWSDPTPPIFQRVNQALRGNWVRTACHETGSLVVQHAFENLEDADKKDIIDEMLYSGTKPFAEICKNPWGTYCIQHIIDHGSLEHKTRVLYLLCAGISDFNASEHGHKTLQRAIRDGDKLVHDSLIDRLCEPGRLPRRPVIVDLALNAAGSQIIASLLPHADQNQRVRLHEAINSHIVTLRGCKSGSKVIWLFERARNHN